VKREQEVQSKKFKTIILIIGCCSGGFILLLIIGFLMCLHIRKNKLCLQKSEPADTERRLVVNSGMIDDDEAIVKKN